MNEIENVCDIISDIIKTTDNLIQEESFITYRDTALFYYGAPGFDIDIVLICKHCRYRTMDYTGGTIDSREIGFENFHLTKQAIEQCIVGMVDRMWQKMSCNHLTNFIERVRRLECYPIKR